jgi:hypothetical protein
VREKQECFIAPPGICVAFYSVFETIVCTQVLWRQCECSE